MTISKNQHEKRMYWYKKGLVDRKIAEKVNRTKKTIYIWRKNHGLKANGKTKELSKEKIDKIYFYNQKGFSISEIAEKVNCSSGSVYYWINKQPKNNDKKK